MPDCQMRYTRVAARAGALGCFWVTGCTEAYLERVNRDLSDSQALLFSLWRRLSQRLHKTERLWPAQDNLAAPVCRSSMRVRNGTMRGCVLGRQSTVCRGGRLRQGGRHDHPTELGAYPQGGRKAPAHVDLFGTFYLPRGPLMQPRAPGECDHALSEPPPTHSISTQELRRSAFDHWSPRHILADIGLRFLVALSLPCSSSGPATLHKPTA